ncbi:MAG: hypothetical protein Q9172_005942 [Xanthocarpia lactea]
MANPLTSSGAYSRSSQATSLQKSSCDGPEFDVHALFVTNDGDLEMKYLGFTISYFLEHLLALCEESAEANRRIMAQQEAGNDFYTPEP